jgi:NAD(P)-dependent dehydrogenase (short-subunit alcohol dehydrogenase family)
MLKYVESLFTLRKQVALVAGANGGMGRHLAKAFADFGADVILADTDIDGLEPVVEQIKNIGRSVLVKNVDITDPKQVDSLVDEANNTIGPVEILLNTVGGPLRKPALEISLEEWNKNISLNLTSAFVCCQAVGKTMVKRKKGKIINISSCAAFFPYPGRSSYSSAKAAINQLTRSLALEWAPYNIHVNAIVPGLTRHEKNIEFFGDPKARRNMSGKIPFGRLGESSDLIGPAIFLASAASNWVTGQCIGVEGGRLISDFYSES